MARSSGGARETVNEETMACMVYGVDAPSKSQRNHIAELCRAGKLDAVKVGRRWLIRIEWPGDAGM